MDKRRLLLDTLAFLKMWSIKRYEAEKSFFEALKKNVGDSMFLELEAVLHALRFEYRFDPFTAKNVSAKVRVGSRELGEIDMLFVSADSDSLVHKKFDINSPPVLEILEKILENFFDLLEEVGLPQHGQSQREH